MKLKLVLDPDASVYTVQVLSDDGKEVIMSSAIGRKREFDRAIENYNANKKVKLKKVDDNNYELTDK